MSRLGHFYSGAALTVAGAGPARSPMNTQAFSDMLRALSEAVSSRSTGAPALQYPLSPEPRVAVFEMELAMRRGKVFPADWTEAQLETFQPEALAGSFDQLMRVSALLREGRLHLPDLSLPLVAITRPHEDRLSVEQQNELWACFQLPVFEQIRDASGELLAYECEARDGFHVASEFRPTGIWRITTERCDCGLATMRMFPATAPVSRMPA